LTPKVEPYQPSGPLATFLAKEAARLGLSPSELLVLAPDHDPFHETPGKRRNAEWFTEQAQRFVPAWKQVHLRGVYYRCLSAGGVLLPNGMGFVGSTKTADLIENAGKYARHLGLIAFSRIVDERAAPPELFLADAWLPVATDDPIRRELVVARGSELYVPKPDLLMPTLSLDAPPIPRQPFRICMVGEKVSLGEVLRPIAQRVRGELLLSTGEVSESAVYGIASRAATDSRPLVILYFSDFDPAGWQMPISVARKLQAHIVREFHDLDVQVIRVGLTREQVKEYDLPDSPIKPGETRAQAWRARWGREQVEIDALAALRPEVLARIAAAAVAPYFDRTFEHRFALAVTMTPEDAAWFRDQPAYQEAKEMVEKAYQPTVQAIEQLQAAQAAALERMHQVEVPALSEEVVTPTMGDAPEEEVVFDSNDSFVQATQKLRSLKSLAPE
jgi:hypothetical protein